MARCTQAHSHSCSFSKHLCPLPGRGLGQVGIQPGPHPALCSSPPAPEEDTRALRKRSKGSPHCAEGDFFRFLQAPTPNFTILRSDHSRLVYSTHPRCSESTVAGPCRRQNSLEHRGDRKRKLLSNQLLLPQGPRIWKFGTSCIIYLGLCVPIVRQGQ